MRPFSEFMHAVAGSKRIPEVDSSCRLLIVPLFRGSSRFVILILSHHSRFNVACECNKEEINDDDDGVIFSEVMHALAGSRM